MEPTSLAGPPSTTSHLDIIHLSIFDYYILEVLFNSYRTLILTSRGTCIFIIHTFIHIFYTLMIVQEN